MWYTEYNYILGVLICLIIILLKQLLQDIMQSKVTGFSLPFLIAQIKGCTIFLHDLQKDRIEIKILYGLNIIEFEGVLAHEIIHAWVYKNNLKFDDMTLEGLWNLGSAIIYRQNGSYLSSLLLSSIENNSDPIYGDGYNKMKLIGRLPKPMEVTNIITNTIN